MKQNIIRAMNRIIPVRIPATMRLCSLVHQSDWIGLAGVGFVVFVFVLGCVCGLESGGGGVGGSGFGFGFVMNTVVVSSWGFSCRILGWGALVGMVIWAC